MNLCVPSINVTVTTHGTMAPAASIRNTTDLVLGQTNLFLCQVIFSENKIYSGLNAKWKINTIAVEKIHEAPFCSLSSVRLKQSMCPAGKFFFIPFRTATRTL